MTKKLTRIESQSSLRRLVIGLDPVAGDVVGQAIAQLEVQGFGQPLLHRKFRGLRRAVPAPAADGVAGRNRCRPGEVEFAIDQALGAIVGVTLRTHRLCIDLHQAAAHHRLQFRRRQAARLEKVGDGDTLIGLDVDREAVRRIGRHALQPAVEQVAARHREQQQGGEPQRQRHRLHHGCGKAPAQVDQAVAPAVASPGRAQAAESRQQPARHQGEEGQRDQEAAEHDQAEAQFPRHP
jgi:hypothetical protein